MWSKITRTYLEHTLAEYRTIQKRCSNITASLALIRVTTRSRRPTPQSSVHRNFQVLFVRCRSRWRPLQRLSRPNRWQTEHRLPAKPSSDHICPSVGQQSAILSAELSSLRWQSTMLRLYRSGLGCPGPIAAAVRSPSRSCLCLLELRLGWLIRWPRSANEVLIIDLDTVYLSRHLGHISKSSTKVVCTHEIHVHQDISQHLTWGMPSRQEMDFLGTCPDSGCFPEFNGCVSNSYVSVLCWEPFKAAGSWLEQYRISFSVGAIPQQQLSSIPDETNRASSVMYDVVLKIEKYLCWIQSRFEWISLIIHGNSCFVVTYFNSRPIHEIQPDNDYPSMTMKCW